jgi:hypothetical protein
MLLTLASVVFLGSESLGTRDQIWNSQIWDFLFRHLLRLAWSRWRYSTPPLTSILSLKIKVQVTLRLTVSQSVSLGVEPHLGLMTRYLLFFESYGLVFLGRPLWREDGSVFCIYCSSSPASFSGSSPLSLVTIFYCLRFEISLFITSYDSQGHSNPPTKSQSQNQNYFTTGGLPPISLSWRQAP